MTEIDEAIVKRFSEKTGTPPINNPFYLAVNGKMYNEAAPLGTELPFAMFHELSGIYEYNYTSNFENILMQFNIYAKRPTDSNSLYGKLKALFDNCILSVSGYEHIYMIREQAYKYPYDNYIVRAVEYRIYIQKS